MVRIVFFTVFLEESRRTKREKEMRRRGRKKGKRSGNSLHCTNSVHSLDLKQAVTVEVNSLPKDALDLAYTELTSA